MTGRARAKIRPPKRLQGGTSVDFETTWKSLADSLQEIHTKNASNLSFEHLYRHAYTLVLKKQGEMLYDRVQDLVRSWLIKDELPYIDNHISNTILTAESTGFIDGNVNEKRAAGERLMRALKHVWEDYILSIGMTTDVLMYMDRVYCADNNKTHLFPVAMGLFRDHVLREPLRSRNGITVATLLTDVILYMIELERNGEVIDRALIRSCVYMLEGLHETASRDESGKLYLTMFEPDFLQASATFYRQEGRKLLNTVDAGSFCRHTVMRLNEEEDRCHSALSPASLPKIRKVIDDELITVYMRDVIGLPGSGAKFMIDNDRYDELETIYDLISRVDLKKEPLKEAIQERIGELGQQVNANATTISAAPPSKPSALPNDADKGGPQDKKSAPEKPMNQQAAAAINWVEAVLQLKDKFDHVHKRALREDQSLQTAITRSFTNFINAFPRSSEYLSLFFDENMKKGLKGKTESEVDKILDQGITLLRFVQDKDMFELYYKKHLSRRLLMKRSASMDAERQMISKMKMEVGNTFTQRIEAMFKDMAISEDLTTQYKRHVESLGSEDKERAELEVHVLTSTMWPMEIMGSSKDGTGDGTETDSRASCIFPPAVERVRRGFEKFYLDKHSGRRLTWLPSMGTADIRATFPKCKTPRKTRELNVSTYGMMVLMLFNELSADDHLTCEEIQGRTGIPMHDLCRNLQSLAVAPKTRVLNKVPMSKDVKPDDRFSFNESFTSQFQKVKIGVVSNANRVEDNEERRQTEKKNDDARAAILEAAIVRIMKQRKELTHTQLINEVISQLNARFKPEVPMVKKRIESLIEREYLERIEDAEKPSYRYLA